MSDDGAADNCHVPQLDLPIGNAWDPSETVEGAKSPASPSPRLHSVVLERIVPRLAWIHRDWSPGASAQPAPEEIEEFGRAILGADAEGADRLFKRLRERGLSADALFETLLAPTARRFGELWAQDECDFVDVTVGVGRLRVLLETYSEAPARGGGASRRALLISPPGESHVFGLNVVASFLRAAGWDAVEAVDRQPDDVAELVVEQGFAVVGVTVGEERALAAAARMIEAVRRASRNRAISVMVGGLALHGRPHLALRIGGDALAEDGPSAALLAHKLYLAQTEARAARA